MSGDVLKIKKGEKVRVVTNGYWDRDMEEWISSDRTESEKQRFFVLSGEVAVLNGFDDVKRKGMRATITLQKVIEPRTAQVQDHIPLDWLEPYTDARTDRFDTILGDLEPGDLE